MPTVSKGAMRLFKIRTERLLRAVPTLDLRRKQLNHEITIWEEDLAKLAHRLEEIEERMRENPHKEVEKIVEVDRVAIVQINIAGVMLEDVKSVDFRQMAYSLFSTPCSIDVFVALRREMLDVAERLKKKREALNILAEELEVTTQRINLFEKRLIPNYQEQIRYIRGRLEDGERASVMVAKIAQAGMFAEQFTAETA